MSGPSDKDGHKNESFLTKLRRATLGIADELPIKDTQDAVIREEQKAKAKAATPSFPQQSINKEDTAGNSGAKDHAANGAGGAQGSNGKKFLTSNETSQAFGYGTGVVEGESKGEGKGFLSDFLARLAMRAVVLGAEAEVRVRR